MPNYYPSVTFSSLPSTHASMKPSTPKLLKFWCLTHIQYWYTHDTPRYASKEYPPIVSFLQEIIDQYIWDMTSIHWDTVPKACLKAFCTTLFFIMLWAELEHILYSFFKMKPSRSKKDKEFCLGKIKGMLKERQGCAILELGRCTWSTRWWTSWIGNYEAPTPQD